MALSASIRGTIKRDSMTRENNNHPIQWIDGEHFCRWRGRPMGPDGCKEMFGTDDELYEDGEGYCLIGGRLYGSLKKLKEADGDTDVARDIGEVFPYEDLQYINLSLLREFKKDLDDYYERFNSGNWEDIKQELYDIF